MSLPLLVRPNSVIPIGAVVDRPDYDYSEGVTLQLYQLEDGKQVRVEIPGLDGKIKTRFEIKRLANMIRIQRQGLSKPWKVFLIGVDSVENIDDKQIVSESTWIKLNDSMDRLDIKLK